MTELRIGKHMTGFAVVQDARCPAMYRVRSPGGELSDMVNLTRAKDAVIRLDGPRGLGGSDVAHWDTRERPRRPRRSRQTNAPLPAC